MSSHAQTSQEALNRKSNELATATSQVVAHRVTRMMLAGPVPSQRDRVEFQLMVDEKKQAFTESWLAMSAQTLLASQAIATNAWLSMFSPWLGKGGASGMAAQMQQEGMGVLNKGMAPVHRTAMANAKRLAKTPLVR